jgi:hypothetical protein
LANYQILVKCILDRADLQNQLNQVQQTINNVTGSGGGTGRKGVVVIDPNINSAAIQEVRAKIQSLKTDIASIESISVKGIVNDQGEVTKYKTALVTYKNTIGEIVRETLVWQEANEKLGTTAGWKPRVEDVGVNYAKQRDILQSMGKMQEAAYAEDVKREKAKRVEIQRSGREQAAAQADDFQRTQNLGKMQEAAEAENLQRTQNLGKMQEAAYAEDLKREKAKQAEIQTSGKMQEAAKTEDLKRTQDLGKMQEAALAEDATREKAKQDAVQKLGQMQEAALGEDKQRNQQRLDSLHSLANEENKVFDNRNKLTAQYAEKLKVMQAQHKAAFANPEVQKNLGAFQAQLAKFDGSKKSTLELQQAFSKLNTSVVQYDQSQVNVNKNGQNLIQQLSLAAKKVVEWGIVTGIVYGALRELRVGIQLLLV